MGRGGVVVVVGVGVVVGVVVGVKVGVGVPRNEEHEGGKQINHTCVKTASRRRAGTTWSGPRLPSECLPPRLIIYIDAPAPPRPSF